MKLEVVKVLRGFQAPGLFVEPGARLMAWRSREGAWIVYFNGNDVPVPPGTVVALEGSAQRWRDHLDRRNGHRTLRRYAQRR